MPTIKLTKTRERWRAELPWEPDVQLAGEGFSVSEALMELAGTVRLNEERAGIVRPIRDVEDEPRMGRPPKDSGGPKPWRFGRQRVYPDW